MARFTTDFLAVPASAIRLGGLTGGPASKVIATEILSSLSGRFTISADTTRLIGDLFPAQIPYRKAA